ncbi:MAG: DUF4177 domain-containing protein [Desulfobacterales bacterium]|nr:DUF4177 domain-containing protein [Desulfobacterales bacterium]
MERYEYKISRHPLDRFGQVNYFCQQNGQCSLNEVPPDQTKAVAGVLNEQGDQGWELVHLVFNKDGMMGFWKRRVEN